MAVEMFTPLQVNEQRMYGTIGMQRVRMTPDSVYRKS